MQLLSIENLSLAAEATVVLLLLALVWPQKKFESTRDTTNGDAVSWEPVKFFYLQTCLYRGLYLQHWRETQNRSSMHSAASVPFKTLPFENEENRSNIPFPWQDRLTHLLNRNGFESVLKGWLCVEPMHRGDSCLSMITLCNYSHMVSAHGATVTEQAIQRFASHLAVALSGNSLVARYLPDRFVVLHFASRVAACHKAMEGVQNGISEEGFFKVAGQSQSLSSIVSIVDLHGVSEVASSLDELEEGTLEADRSGRKIVSRDKGAWTGPQACNETDTIDLEKPEVNAEQSPAQSGEAPLNSAPVDASPLQTEVGDSKATVANKSNAEDAEEDEPIASNDISAVANADDIAALFAQINSNKASHSNEAPKLASVSPVAIDSVDAPLPAAAPTAAVAVDLSEAATADDIASLFETVKSAEKPQVFEPPKPSQETKAPDPILETKPSMPSLPTGKEISDAASSDDIEALFAAMKPEKASVQPKPASAKPLSASAETDSASVLKKEPLIIKPTSTDTVDLSSVASVDDIEALFASMKK